MKGVDTIAAVATPPGRGGIGIVRVSGPDTGHIVRGIVGTRPVAPYRAAYRAFLNERGEVIDSGVVLFFRAPRSYTGEDVLELHGHGGPVVLGMILARVLALGARPARPGEFTFRAFMNDKLDLAQAEAVADLINSQTETAARSAQRALQGVFSQRVEGLAAALADARKWVETAIDFPDEDLEFLAYTDLHVRVSAIMAELEETLDRAAEGALLREGATLVIAGRPNVGKSSLLNRLTGQETAIVTHVPGTTRDLLREQISLDGLPVRIVDTAGLRETADVVETQGIERAWNEARRADAILLVLDEAGFTAEDERIYDELPNSSGKLVVRNKIDLIGAAPGVAHTHLGIEISVSALTGAGIDRLRDELKRIVGYVQTGEPLYIARQRHLDALTRALQHVRTAQQGLAGSTGMELIAEDLRLAQRALGEITGEFSSEDLLNLIFGDFCIGK